MDGNLEQQVRQRAYELWMVGSIAGGRDIDYWCAAERELRERNAAKAADQTIDQARPAARKARGAAVKRRKG